MHGHMPFIFGAFQIIRVVVVGVSLYLLYSVAKSLKQIAARLDKIDRLP